MKSKLNLDPKVVDSARQHAANIAHDMQEFIERHTTVSLVEKNRKTFGCRRRRRRRYAAS